MFTTEKYNRKAKRYQAYQKARTRGNAILQLSLLGSKGRVKDADGNVLFTRTDTGKLSVLR